MNRHPTAPLNEVASSSAPAAKHLVVRVPDPRVRWIVDTLRKNDLSHRITTEEVANAVHISTSRLRHLFRTEVGMPLGRYLKQLRLERARALLESSFLEIKEVAAAVGFSDVSHFVRDYKLAYRERPSETRVRSKSA
jgi:transcriptional regulator GlxA family with amidase domain